MESFLENLNLIDLVSETHFLLRNLVEDRWKEIGKFEITHSEAHLLAKIEHSPLSISEASRLLNISRQATQKCARNLEERDFLFFGYREGNKRDKYMFLSERGAEYCLCVGRLKRKIESEIGEILGESRVGLLKDLLKSIKHEA